MHQIKCICCSAVKYIMLVNTNKIANYADEQIRHLPQSVVIVDEMIHVELLFLSFILFLPCDTFFVRQHIPNKVNDEVPIT